MKSIRELAMSKETEEPKEIESQSRLIFDKKDYCQEEENKWYSKGYNYDDENSYKTECHYDQPEQAGTIKLTIFIDSEKEIGKSANISSELYDEYKSDIKAKGIAWKKIKELMKDDIKEKYEIMIETINQFGDYELDITLTPKK